MSRRIGTPAWFVLGSCGDRYPDGSPVHDPSLWFPVRPVADDDAGDENDSADSLGAEAKAVCARCPVRADCLLDAIDRGETVGVWGGAGGDHLRHLARVRHGGDVDAWETAIARHFAGLAQLVDPDPAVVLHVVDRNGPGATHGLLVTYNRGCRCGACEWAAADDSRRVVAA